MERMRFGGRVWRVGKAFDGYPVALLPAATDGVFTVCFLVHPIAQIDLRDGIVTRQSVEDVSAQV